MKFALIVNGIVDATYPNPREGLVEVPDDVFGGYIDNGDGTFTAPEVPPFEAPPREALRADFRTGLAVLGHLTSVESAVAASNISVQIAYEDATSFMENDPTIVAMAAQLSLDISAVFDAADAARMARKASLLT